MRRVKTWTETHSDARVLVTANDIGKNGWFEVWTRMPRGSVIDVTPAWQQRQLRHQEYRRPAIIAAAIVFFAGLVVLFGIRQNYDSPPRDIQTARVFAGPPDAAHPAIAGALTPTEACTSNMRWGRCSRWPRRGVIDIREEAKGAFGQRKFTIRKGHASRPLAPHEQALLHEVFSAKGASEREVPLDKARTHLVRHFSKLKAIVEREMTDEGLFDDGRRQMRRRYNVVGIVLLVLAGIALVPAIVLVGPHGSAGRFSLPLTIAILAVTSFIFSAAHTPLSNLGVRRAEAWRAYQKQLRDVPKDLRRADWTGGPIAGRPASPRRRTRPGRGVGEDFQGPRRASAALVPRRVGSRCEHRFRRLRRPRRRRDGRRRWRWRRRGRRRIRGRVGLARPVASLRCLATCRYEHVSATFP